MTIANKVREYKAANPEANGTEIAKACNTSQPYVWQILNPKPKKVEEPKDPTQGQKVLRKELTSLNKETDQLKDLNKILERNLSDANAYIESLQEQINDLTVVVTYLEEKLGIEDQQY